MMRIPIFSLRLIAINVRNRTQGFYNMIVKLYRRLRNRVSNGNRVQLGERLDGFEDIFVTGVEKQTPSLNKISILSNNIHGMIDSRAGEALFMLAYMQNLSGDVLEIGSFQGKSTYFLGTAVKLSSNGKVYAVDHFKGNKGKERYYRVLREDLLDLEDGFIRNMALTGLSETVKLINKPSSEAAQMIQDESIRLLFIDADHTALGVTSDLFLFTSKLKNGALIVFDDYDEENFSGLVAVVNNFIERPEVRRVYRLNRMIVAEFER